MGVTTAYALLLSGLASEIVLLDIDHNRAAGEAMDLSHAAHYSHAKVRVAQGYEDCAGATLVILTAGVNQKPGQTRLDLVKTNYALFQSVVPQVARNAPDTILLVATNPVDVLTHAAYELSGFPVERVIGSGTAMDTTRFRHELGKHYGVNPRNVQYVLARFRVYRFSPLFPSLFSLPPSFRGCAKTRETCWANKYAARLSSGSTATVSCLYGLLRASPV